MHEIQKKTRMRLSFLFAYRQRMGNPEIIYHYTSVDALYSIINKGCLWASNCLFLNDAEEIVHIRELLLSRFEIAKENANPPIRMELPIHKVFDDVMRVAGDVFFVLSFSTLSDSLPLWTGYFGDTGYSMGFDFESIARDMDPIMWRKKWPDQAISQLLPVIYDNEKQKFALDAYIDILVEYIQEFQNGVIESDLFNQAMNVILIDVIQFGISVKKLGYSCEGEYRIVFSHDPEEPKKALHRVRRSEILPYIEIDLRDENRLLPLKEIVLSPKTSTDNDYRGIRSFLDTSGYSSVALRSSALKMRY